jgi:glutamine synthetase
MPVARAALRAVATRSPGAHAVGSARMNERGTGRRATTAEARTDGCADGRPETAADGRPDASADGGADTSADGRPDTSALVSKLAAQGVEYVRVAFVDLHGVARGKDIPLEELPRAVGHGLACAEAILTTGLRHNVVAGSQRGFPDVVIRPDVSTLVRLPWDPVVAWCLSDYEDRTTLGDFPLDARAALRRTCRAYSELGLTPLVGPELEFYVCDPATYASYPGRGSAVYTVGDAADPRRLLREMTSAARALGLLPIAASQEFGRGQYEINLRHTDALDAADRTFRFKAAMKDVAARHGLLATFMAKPHTDDEGSGFHLHISLAGPAGNLFADPADADGLSMTARSFAAGVLAHAPALTAILTPTVNGYRRLQAGGLAPRRANWGHDNRLALLRFPAERGPGTRLEVRGADGTANPYLALAALLAAGLDGLRHELELGPDVIGDPNAPGALHRGPPLPGSLDEALSALGADEIVRACLGEELWLAFARLKQDELERWSAHLSAVTDWERAEYAPLL